MKLYYRKGPNYGSLLSSVLAYYLIAYPFSGMETNVDKIDTKVWPENIIKAFIEIMAHEVSNGNMPNGVFHSKIWNSIKDKLNSQTGRFFNLKQVKQKFNRLRCKHREFSLLLQQSGFGWNPETNTVTASEEVWQAYVRVHPEAAQFQKRGCEQYKLLGLIFNRSTATGVLHYSSTQDPPNTDEENELETQYLNSGIHVSNDQGSSDEVQTSEHTTRNGKRPIQVKQRKSKKDSKSFDMGDALIAWAEASKAKTEYTLAKVEKYKAKCNESSSTTLQDYSMARCVIALDGIEAISDDIYHKALTAFRDADWREAFLTMPDDRKKGWLARLD